MLWDKKDQQKIKRQALAQFTESFDLFYEHSIAIDAQSRVTWISEAYYHFLELQDSPIGHDIKHIIPNSFLPAVMKSGEPLFLDLLLRKDQWIVVSAFPLQDDEGEIVGGFGFVASESVSQIKPLLAKYNNLQHQLQDVRNTLEKERSSRYHLSQIVGRSSALQAVKKKVRQAARFDISVLLTGETGTGKELFARALHDLSARCVGPFVGVNVASIPESLIEAEFFGVAPGAFTGASKEGRVGKFELANGGTLFLDEIGDMPIDLQAKLLRVLQEREFEAIGSNTLKKTDVRIIAATSRNLLERVDSGHFRADLYYRLSSLPIHLPPLRERPSDIEALCEKFVDEISAQLEIPAKELTPDALQKLRVQAWPGNVRELRNVLERACVLSEDAEINASCLQPLLSQSKPVPQAANTAFSPSQLHVMAKPKELAEVVLEAERAAIVTALAYTRNNKTDAAKILRISRASLYQKINKMAI